MYRNTGRTAPTPAWNADGPDGGETVLLPVVGEAVSDGTLATARAVALGDGLDVVVVRAVTVPEQTPLSLTDRLLSEHRAAARRVADRVGEGAPSLSVDGHVRVGRSLSSVVADAAASYGTTRVVCDERWTESRLSPVTPAPVERVLTEASCPVAVPDAPLPERVNSVLVPVAGSPHSPAAADVAGAVAAARDAWVELLHVVTEDDTAGRARAEAALSRSGDRLSNREQVDTWVLEADDVADAVVEQSQYYDVTVVGAPRIPRLRRYFLGSTADSVRRSARSGLVTVW